MSVKSAREKAAIIGGGVIGGGWAARFIMRGLAKTCPMRRALLIWWSVI